MSILRNYDLKDLSILVVEDVEQIRSALINILVEMGFTKIAAANNGLQALRKMYMKREDDMKNYDLIITDINMPYLDGLELLVKLKSDEDYKDIPVIFISTEDQKDTILKAFTLGAKNYIIKPFSMNIVVKKIAEVLPQYFNKI